MRRGLLIVWMGCSLFGTVGCKQPEEPIQAFEPAKDYSQPLPPGALALRKLDNAADYPDFSDGYYNRNRLEDAVKASRDYLSRASSQRYFPCGDITHDRAMATLDRFLEVLDEARSPDELNEAVRREFDVYQSIGCDGRGTVYFTGYYCPIFDGRMERSEQYRHPLYALPPDLVKDEEGRVLGRRQEDGTTVPYYTRRELEEGNLLAGGEIAWLKDPFEAYVATVQGSAKLRLQDASILELGYAANNGHEYTPVGREMVADGLIASNDLSLQAMMRYFAEHPGDVPEYCWRNDRTVFFTESPGGPFGSINVPVRPFHSLATDKEVFPRACLAFVDTRLPMAHEGKVYVRPYAGFALDQDTGGAIRAAGRCDVYMGVGAKAGALAGRPGAEGRLYYLFVKPELMAATAQP